MLSSAVVSLDFVYRPSCVYYAEGLMLPADSLASQIWELPKKRSPFLYKHLQHMDLDLSKCDGTKLPPLWWNTITANSERCSLSYLGGGHVADRAVGLDGLQLVQTPLQLLHCLHGQFLVRVICQQTAGTQRHTVRTDRAHGARTLPSRSTHGSRSGFLLLRRGDC